MWEQQQQLQYSILFCFCFCISPDFASKSTRTYTRSAQTHSFLYSESEDNEETYWIQFESSVFLQQCVIDSAFNKLVPKFCLWIHIRQQFLPVFWFYACAFLVNNGTYPNAYSVCIVSLRKVFVVPLYSRSFGGTLLYYRFTFFIHGSHSDFVNLYEEWCFIIFMMMFSSSSFLCVRDSFGIDFPFSRAPSDESNKHM